MSCSAHHILKSVTGIVLAAFLLAPATGQAAAGNCFDPGIPYYFDTFDPVQKPWEPGQGLNYEEVYKNYSFFEIIFSASGEEITVNGYINNIKTDSARYRLDPDGSLHGITGGNR